MGAELCLAHDIGGGGIWGPPFGRHAALRLFHLKFTAPILIAVLDTVEVTPFFFKIFSLV